MWGSPPDLGLMVPLPKPVVVVPQFTSEKYKTYNKPKTFYKNAHFLANLLPDPGFTVPLPGSGVAALQKSTLDS